MEEEIVQPEDSNLEENLDSNQETEVADLSEEPKTNEELDKAKKIAENQRIRAEKAERELKALKKVPVEKETSPSTEDELYALIEAKVPKEDVGLVRQTAKVLGISILESLSNPILKALLNQKAEERASAIAANTTINKRGIKITSEERLLEEFENGKLPEKDEDIKKLVEAQLARKKLAAKSN